MANPDGKDKPPIYLANYGDIVCVYTWKSAMLDLPVKSPERLDDRMYEAHTERIPPQETKVMVIFEAVKEKKRNKADRRASRGREPPEEVTRTVRVTSSGDSRPPLAEDSDQLILCQSVTSVRLCGVQCSAEQSFSYAMRPSGPSCGTWASDGNGTSR